MISCADFSGVLVPPPPEATEIVERGGGKGRRSTVTPIICVIRGRFVERTRSKKVEGPEKQGVGKHRSHSRYRPTGELDFECV